MRKKGATHADWAISLGLFLIYILTMFMILQPGIQPIYKETELLDNLQNEITTQTEFIITKTPLIIDTAQLESAGTYYIKISSELPLEKDENKAAIFDNAGNYNDNNNIDLATGLLEFEAPLALGSNKYWAYEIIKPEKIGSDYQYDNFFSSDAAEVSNIKNNFTFSFGAPEIVKGLDWNQLNSEVLNEEGFSCTGEDANDDYSVLKNILGHPSNKEFIIQAVESSNPRYSLEDLQDICHIEDPFEQASVFTREWLTYKVNKEGMSDAVRVHVVIW